MLNREGLIPQKPVGDDNSSQIVDSLVGQISLTDRQEIIGKFSVGSGRIVVSDPCYDFNPSPEIQAVVENARPGTWKASLVMISETWREPAALYAHHEEFPVTFLSDYRPYGRVSVDSGTIGVYDVAKFRSDDVADPMDPEIQEFLRNYRRDRSSGVLWYAHFCTLCRKSAINAAVIDGGVVSGTGIGDGTYGLYVARNPEQETVGVMVIFDFARLVRSTAEGEGARKKP